MTVVLRCIECDVAAEEGAPGWLALRVEDPDAVEGPEVAFYCPACAEREFASD